MMPTNTSGTSLFLLLFLTGRCSSFMTRRNRTPVANHPATTQLAASRSWSDLESACSGHRRDNNAEAPPLPVTIDSVFTPDEPIYSQTKPTLFRERHGWCPYSERVWLALELENVGFVTVKIDNTGHGPKPRYWSGTTPKMKWPDDGRIQGESMDLVYEIMGDDSNDGAVQQCVADFRTIFPRARPSSRAAFLFSFNGDPLPRSTFETTLQKTNELLERSTGPFFCGDKLTAADVAWAPFLERYRYQLPALHAGLDPYSATLYPALQAWYDAMDTTVPAYKCRVAGNASSWRKVLVMAGFGNAGNVPPQVADNIEALDAVERCELRQGNYGGDDDARASNDVTLWRQYKKGASHRAYLADTPGAEAASIICRNREALLLDTLKRTKMTEADIDRSLRDLATTLLALGDKNKTTLNDVSPSVVALACFLDERMCVPRDMGVLSASCIKRVAAAGAG